MKLIKQLLLLGSIIVSTASCSSTQTEALLDSDQVGLSATEQRILGLGGCVELSTTSTKWTLEEVSVITVDRYADDDTIAAVTERPMLKADAPFEYVLDSLTVNYANKGLTLQFGELPELYSQVRYYKLVLVKGADRQVFTGRQELLDGESRDYIRLNPDSVTFTADGGTASFTTMESPWRFCNIRYAGGRFELLHNIPYTFPWAYSAEWFDIERPDLSHFTITARPNDSGSARSGSITLMLGDLFAHLKVYQAAE